MSEYACKRNSCGTLTRIWASKAADTSWLAEIHLKYTCFQRFGKGLAKSPTSLTLSSPSPSLRCASFTHAPSVRRLNPSLKIIHWRTAGESRWTTLGASLLGVKVSTRFFYFSLALLSLLRSPNPPASPKNQCQVWKWYRIKHRGRVPSRKNILRVLRTESQSCRCRGPSTPSGYLRGTPTPCTAHFLSAAVKKIKSGSSTKHREPLKVWNCIQVPKLNLFKKTLKTQQIPGEAEGLLMAQQCLSVVFVRLRLQIWAQRGFFVVGGWKHVSGLHLIG